MRLSKAWLIAGAALGLLISIGVQTYGMLLLGRIPSVVVFLFWPCGFLAGFYFPGTPLVLPAILANALLFGAVAAILRSRFLLVLTALLIVGWWATPPSDRRLTRQFGEHRTSLQRLVDVSKQESGIVRITANEIETAEGKVYRVGDAAAPLTNGRWNEYRQQIRDLNVTGIAFGRDKSGEVFAFSKTPKIGFFRSSYGYLYCPEVWDKPIYFVPCLRGGNSWDSRAYHYQQVDRNWYIYEMFEPQRIE